MKKYRKSVWMPLVLFIYTTAMALYFLPGNTSVSNEEKWITFIAAYVIIALLAFVLRKKEKMMDQYREKTVKQRREENERKAHEISTQEKDTSNRKN